MFDLRFGSWSKYMFFLLTIYTRVGVPGWWPVRKFLDLQYISYGRNHETRDKWNLACWCMACDTSLRLYFALFIHIIHSRTARYSYCGCTMHHSYIPHIIIGLRDIPPATQNTNTTSTCNNVTTPATNYKWKTPPVCTDAIVSLYISIIYSVWSEVYDIPAGGGRGNHCRSFPSTLFGMWVRVYRCCGTATTCILVSYTSSKVLLEFSTGRFVCTLWLHEVMVQPLRSTALVLSLITNH